MRSKINGDLEELQRELNEVERDQQVKMEQIMEERKIYQYRAGDRALFITDAGDKYTAAVAAPVISEGDALGLVLFVSEGDGKVTGDTEYKLAQTIAAFLGKHMEG